MNHFHKHPIVREERAQLAHMNALHYCTVFGAAPLVHDLGSTAYS